MKIFIRVAEAHPTQTGCKSHFEYDLLSGKFLNVYSSAGSKNDKTYGKICLENTETNDLFIRDLGYFDLKDLNRIDKQDAFFVSRVKLDTRIYVKNPNPEKFDNGAVKKHSEYTKLDLKENMNSSTSTGKAMLQMIGVIAELESNLLAERVKEGIASSRRRGTVIGRTKIPQNKLNVAIRMYDSGDYSIKEIIVNTGVSQGSLYREINRIKLLKYTNKK